MKNLILFGLILSSMGCNTKLTSTAIPSRPNIIFIMVDDLGKEWVSHYGAENISTPNIDALATSGMTFHNVYSMPQCTPTRVTLLTGQYPFKHGWVNHWDVPRWGGGAHFDENMNPSLGIEMKKAGYTTCIAGKWQIDDFRVEPDALTKNGFDEYCMWTGYETGIEASANRYQDPYIYTKQGSKTYEGEFGPDVFKNFIIDFIANNKNKPMFIYYPMVLTHTPFVNTPLDTAMNNSGKHKAMVKYTDKITGEIIKALDDAGIRENTLVIWTTDNGTSGAITGKINGRMIKGGKAKTIESGINAPFIASWPGKIIPNQASESLIDFTDFYPTFLDLAGVDLQKQLSNFKIDGKSFKDALLNGEEAFGRTWILAMGGGNHAALTNNGVENQYNFRDRVLRNKKYKLYINSEREAKLFFDLQIDPEEMINLIDSLNSEERKNNFQQLYKIMESFPLKDNDPMYQVNPPQTWDVAVTKESQKWKK